MIGQPRRLDSCRTTGTTGFCPLSRDSSRTRKPVFEDNSRYLTIAKRQPDGSWKIYRNSRTATARFPAPGSEKGARRLGLKTTSSACAATQASRPRIECRTARNLKGLILVPLEGAEG